MANRVGWLGFSDANFFENSRGFTVTEVMMFLAISGMLLAGALAGVSANINNTRFNDAIRSNESFLQQQYDEVASGRNSRDAAQNCVLSGSSIDFNTTGSQPAGQSDCVMMGRFLYLQNDTITVRYIIGHWDRSLVLPGDDQLALQNAGVRLRVAPEAVYGSQYAIPWEIRLRDSDRFSPGQAVGLAIVRSPVSGSVSTYSFQAASPEENNIKASLTSANRNQDLKLCFTDDDRFGNILLKSGQGQEVIQADPGNTAGSC